MRIRGGCFSWLLLATFLASIIHGDRISKCHHEGDINLNCNKKNMPSDTPELIRSAKLINGLYYNDSLCSFVPGTSCYRQLSLNECIDKSNCSIKNSWYSLEPECSGNSYYAQVEYECQPSYHICDSPTVINNVFSGVIYSPHYPGSFRSESNTPCFLTIQVPKKHHIQITLDYFNLLLTKSCVGDYLEIQEYIKDKSNFKWKTLGTMCGERQSKFTLRAMSDIINIKFRPLEYGHQFLHNVKQSKNYGFKIYFEAVPPDAPAITVPIMTPTPLSNGKPNNPTTTEQQEPLYITQEDNKQTSEGSSFVFILIGISIFVLIIIIIAIVLVICLIKRMKLNKTENSNSKNSTSAPLLTKKPISNNDEPIPKIIPPITTTTPSGPISVHVGDAIENNNKPQPVRAPIANKTKIVMEEEPRKMKTELPALLQDLGTSKLLLKFQQQQSLSSKKDETSEINETAESNKQDEDTKKRESLDLTESNSPNKPNLSFENSGIYDGTEQQKTPQKQEASSRKSSSKNSSLKFKSRKHSSKSLTKTNSGEQTAESQPTTKVEIIENDKIDLLKITHMESLSQQESVDFDDGKFGDFVETKLEIIEETKDIQQTDSNNLNNNNKNLVTFTLPSFPNRASTVCSTTTDEGGSPIKSNQKPTTTHRKSVFNPLHVILKDKNKYYTTEYI